MKNLKAMKQAQTWQEKADIAEDKTPGTPFDRVFEVVKQARFFVTTVKLPGERRARLEALGGWLADLIEKGDSPTLHKMADALNIWERHVPSPDKIRAATFRKTGMFPEFKLSIEDIRASLRSKGIETDTAASDKAIRRASAEISYRLRHRASPGRKPGKRDKSPSR